MIYLRLDMLSFIHQLVFIYTNYLWFLCKRERSWDVHSDMQATCVETLRIAILSCASKLYCSHINWCLSTPLNLWSLRAVTELWIALCFCIYFVITAYRSQYTRSQHDAAHWYCFGKIHKLGGFEKSQLAWESENVWHRNAQIKLCHGSGRQAFPNIDIAWGKFTSWVALKKASSRDSVIIGTNCHGNGSASIFR